MTTSISLSYLISRCPAPVSTSAGVTDGLLWIDLVNVWLRVTTEEIPNKQHIMNLCELYTPMIHVGYDVTNYVDVNDMLMHVKSGLLAVQSADETNT